ncbi:EAL and modified HD-GYP domain-containing signal transduction protein [Clostridium tetanomorphum]|uniref:HDOD domain-containing protein n=1 Tax=Clostridium tetanomorphum TaxID=1553 RepID=A0A923E8I6_CLOTT|nr:HDOD domain-containing protein [Clostridium tetanomorphum]KAJ52029.1 diguanylate phosphodiesterase [Clostridium tetanomorphum DSM 665]MBC2397039.1 HDOD domain-containing protein [Clostridium tetanomorphum]MBP1862949.1 EAL and modified HD-GYP domain-containing signal transduction protein [Clostridium tetanomorphum]NRS87086.1 EAL and modified HD-GYP domain-containing signal transduction protein [Clostridium tetanomorphum]NRZ99119.1 EAL and modified HD-GYP domain-containing signal transduction
MNIFIARQPIFNKDKSVIFYELLYRSNLNNFCEEIDGNKATYKVIADSFYLIGIHNITAGKRALINFTEDLLKEEIGTILPKELVAIEILETVKPTKEILQCLKRLKNKGYVIALDDFVFHKKYQEFIELTDIIKIDFRTTLGKERKEVIKKISRKDIKFLAEKIECEEEFKEAVSYGYTYFQGYFFCKPSVLKARDIPANKLAHIKIMEKINLNELDFDDLGELIKRDVSLSYKLLRAVNNSYMGLKGKISSIEQAMGLFGIKELYKWINVVLISNIAKDKPDELIKISIIRAKFCEEISKRIKANVCEFNAYITGLLSMIDVILDMPMEKALENLAVPSEVKYALLGNKNYLSDILCLVLSYENGEWKSVSKKAKELKILEWDIGECYLKAIKWISIT